MLEAKKDLLRDNLLTPFIRWTNICNCNSWVNKTQEIFRLSVYLLVEIHVDAQLGEPIARSSSGIW